jgi:hypothetical protein
LSTLDFQKEAVKHGKLSDIAGASRGQTIVDILIDDFYLL